uniref:Glyco_transf_20 domain-containing protein n=1 Tax=Trichuris muris TaxID=70415 RepID=A0A5S6QKJ6_TRIMR
MSCRQEKEGSISTSRAKRLGPPFIQSPQNVDSHDFEAIASTIHHLVKAIDPTCKLYSGTSEGRELVTCNNLYERATPILIECWTRKEGPFENAFLGLLLLLEHCLAFHLADLTCVSCFIQGLKDQIGDFLRDSYNNMAICDRVYNTAYCVVLMQQLTLYEVDCSTGILAIVFFKVPALKEVILTGCTRDGVPTWSSPTQRESEGALTDVRRDGSSAKTQKLLPEQEQEHLIAMSNAPPIKVKVEEGGEVQIQPGGGGLVTCCEPALRNNPNNVWLTCFRPSVPVVAPAGRGTAMPANHSDISHAMLVKNRVRDFCKHLYQLCIVPVPKQDYEKYYTGIANGLFWPAFHHLPEYIAQDYEDQVVLFDHWYAYMRVSFYFSVDALRKCNNVDFVWVHDYHLMLVAMIIRMYNPKIDTGFFLHIPFNPPKDFFVKYHPVATIILRALLSFRKLGFQTVRDAKRFIGYVQERLSGAVVVENTLTEKCVKTDDFLKFAYDQEIQATAATLRAQLMGDRRGKLFFSAERFDYTKGIRERLLALELYLDKYPERVEQDRFLQIAIINRTSVHSYKRYQEACMEIVRRIQRKFENEEKCPLIVITSGLPRKILVAHYMAMDVGVVTPLADGMNLVSKEMLTCNPNARIILSTGAGVESQLFEAGFYPEKGQRYYLRVEDVKNAEQFCNVLYTAAVEDQEEAGRQGRRLQEFIANNDIEKWRNDYLDPQWVDPCWECKNVATLDEFRNVAARIRILRKRMIGKLARGIGNRRRDWASIGNMLTSLLQSCPANALNKVAVQMSSSRVHLIDVSNEVVQLKTELKLSRMLPQADRNLHFNDLVHCLGKYTDLSKADFAEEVRKARMLVGRDVPFDLFVSSFYGTLTRRTSTAEMAQQPIHSTLAVTAFATQCTVHTVIISTEGLKRPGLLDDFLIDKKTIDFGGFMGQEWIFFSQHSETYSCLPFFQSAVQEQVNKVYKRICEVANAPENEIFSIIGGGIRLQVHCVAVPQQDCYGSIPMRDCNRWFSRVKETIAEIGDLPNHCEVQDDGTHISIRTKQAALERAFTKADGIAVYCEKMGINISEQRILMCGSSANDLPMLDYLLGRNAANVNVVWVVSNSRVRNAVEAMFEKYKSDRVALVSCPEVLLSALAEPLLADARTECLASRCDPENFK